VGCCEHSDKSSGSITGEFLNKLNNYQQLKEDPVSWSWLVNIWNGNAFTTKLQIYFTILYYKQIKKLV
jgi:hypothetical protein